MLRACAQEATGGAEECSRRDFLCMFPLLPQVKTEEGTRLFTVPTFNSNGREKLVTLVRVFHSCHELQLRFQSLHPPVAHPMWDALIWASGANK